MELQWIFLALATYSLTSEALVIPSINHITTYDPEELLQKIFDPITTRAAGYGLIRFEDHSPYPDDTSDPNGSEDTTSQDSGFVTFEEEISPDGLRRPVDVAVKFEDSQQDTVGAAAGADNFHESITSNNNNEDVQIQRPLQFEGSSNQGQRPQFSGQKKKKRRRRRRRKPRFQRPPFTSGPGVPGLPQYAPEYQSLDSYTPSPGYPGPPRIAPPEGALATVTQGLASIARHDDLQCVPRLLCEAAGGATSGSASGSTPSKLLQTISGLQPLLTLLSAGGLGGSPLLVFGRAVLLGTGEGGATACPPAYPACPTDPERLIHYLNNHNGGFFRFFNVPKPLQDLHNQQYPQPYAPHHYGNLINQPGVQGYGLLQQPHGQISNQLPGQQNYGLLQHTHSQIPDQQTYAHAGNYLNQVTDQGYGFAPGNQEFPGHQSGYGYQGSHNGNYKDKKYGPNYVNHQTNKDNKIPRKHRIENRIQNIRPGKLGSNQILDPFVSPETDDNSYFNKLRFPQDSSIGVQYLNLNQSNKAEKGFRFPGLQSNRQYFVEKQYDPYENSVLDYSNPVRLSLGNNAQQYDYDREEIVYVVRGNGDPNHPEIVKLKPGQKLHK